ncbi:unnamed protein product, partial [Allacma fusca]
MALCLLCERDGGPLPKLVTCKGHSTSGLISHLSTKHQVLVKDPNSGNRAAGQQFIVKKNLHSKGLVTDLFEPLLSMNSLIALLVAEDGISFRRIAKSTALRRLFRSEFGSLPKSHVTVRRRFMKYAESIKKEK